MLTLYLHPQNPQKRLLEQINNALKDGKIIAYPTETGYALLTHLHAKNTANTLARIEQTVQTSEPTLICKSISEAANQANINNAQFRQIKNQTAPATRFILEASKQTPKHLLAKNKQVAIQLSEYTPLVALLNIVGEPLVITDLDNQQINTQTPYDIEDLLANQVDMLVNIDAIENVQTLNVIDLTDLTD